MKSFKLKRRKKTDFRLNERVLLKKVIEHSLLYSDATQIYKANLELLAWHEFQRQKTNIVNNYNGSVNYRTYCLAALVRIVNSYMHTSVNKAV